MSTSLIVTIICVVVFVVAWVFGHAIVDAHYWHTHPLKNFEFVYRGKKFWYSRSVAAAVFVFAKNALGEWCVLANQRGKGCPDYNFYWSCPCGYCDFDEFLCHTDENGRNSGTAYREVEEECGLELPSNCLQFYTLNDSPIDSNKQNITARYYGVIDNVTTEDASLQVHTTDLGEKDEVADIKWIPLSELDNYQWAFGHKTIIREIVANKF